MLTYEFHPAWDPGLKEQNTQVRRRKLKILSIFKKKLSGKQFPDSSNIKNEVKEEFQHLVLRGKV